MNDRFAGCLGELERQALLPDSYVAAMLVGSASRGWDNGQSDYDIYLVSPQPWQDSEQGMGLRVPLAPPLVPIAVLHVDGRRWEVKYWLDSQVDQMLAKVSWKRFENGRVADQFLVDTEEVFLERVITCVPLAGVDWVQRRRDELSRSAFGAFVVTRSLAKADDSIEDAAGQLAAGDAESAVISARKAFGHMVDALLESVGEYGYWTPKWRVRRLRAAAPAALPFAQYWAIETMRDFDPRCPATWAEQVLRACRELSMKIVVPG